MRTVFMMLVMLISNGTFSQSIDYNTKKGFVAQGYDVIAYFDNVAVEGKKEYTTEHDGVDYKFASKEHLETFKANPKKYIPQYGGYCAYAIADSKKVNIDPKSYQVMDGKLYLFYNSLFANTLKSWNEEGPEILKQKADENWKSIMKKE